MTQIIAKTNPQARRANGYVRDQDRVTYIQRFRRLKADIDTCPEPVVGQVRDGMERSHARFLVCRDRRIKAGQDWKAARVESEAAVGASYRIIAYVGRQVRQQPDDDWLSDGQPPKETEQRFARLLGGHNVADLRDRPTDILDALVRLDRIFQTDAAEAARWKPELIPALRAAIRRHREALEVVGLQGRRYRQAVEKLREAREAWDFHWDLTSRCVVGWFKLQDREDMVESVFRPLRTRPAQVSKEEEVESLPDQEEPTPAVDAAPAEEPEAEVGEPIASV